jgi:hypothetical protein
VWRLGAFGALEWKSALSVFRGGGFGALRVRVLSAELGVRARWCDGLVWISCAGVAALVCSGVSGRLAWVRWGEVGLSAGLRVMA